MGKSSSRYPYTYAADYIRGIISGSGKPLAEKLSRSEAASIRKHIADCIGASDEDVAKALADHFLRENW